MIDERLHRLLWILSFFNFMMQKNSMVETQSLDQRNKKDTQRKKHNH